MLYTSLQNYLISFPVTLAVNIGTMKKTLFAFLIFILTFHLTPQAYSEDKIPKKIQNYRVGVGDLLQIEVYEEEDLTKEVRVLTDGYISFPLIGQIKTSGLTVEQLEAEITRLLAEKYLVSPQVTVFVKEFSDIFVFGEVKKPGSFPLYGKLTVFEAITLAGGFTEVANPSKVKVIRDENGKETSFEVNVEQMTKKGNVSADVELRAGDRVIVPRSFF